MATTFTREHLKICIAKICLTIGWHNTTTTPMEMLTDILYNYLYYIGKTTTDYAHQFGMTEANLEHLSLTFKDFRVNLKDFNEYLNSVECPSKLMVPKYPLPKQDHLNFLKPGSKEVVSRQVHVHEHLPPMFPLLEYNNEENFSVENMDIENKSTVSVQDVDSKKRPRIIIGHSVRELTSVMMTTSGFLSPAREGKLPESRTPAIALEPSVSPTEPFKRPVKMKKFFKMRREFFKQFSDHESLKKAMKIKKRKIKFRNMMAAKNYMIVSNTNKPVQQEAQNAPLPLRQQAVMVKNILPPQGFTNSTVIKDEPFVEKLSTKPCKRKINILRKISVKTKPPKICKEEPKISIGESVVTPDVTVLNSFPNDLVIEPIHPVQPPLENSRKKKINILRKPTAKTRKNDKVEAKSTNNMEGYLSFANDITFKYQASNNLNIEPVNLVLPTDTVNKEKANILKKISNKTKLNKTTNNRETNKHYSTDFTASIMKDVGLHHNICKDLIIEPVGALPPAEKPVKLESYYSNVPRIDTTITAKTGSSTVIKLETLREPMLRSPKTFMPSKFDFDAGHPKVTNSPVNLPQPTLPPMHFPFFNPFAGPGLIPPPLMNPLFPHLPIPPLGLPTFGQLPMPVPTSLPKNPVNISNPEITVTKQQHFNKVSQVETLKDDMVLEPESTILDLKFKKKKKKRDKIKHKTEKRKKEKSDSKKMKKQSKLSMNNSSTSLPEYDQSFGPSNIPTMLMKPKSETLLPEENIHKREVSPELAKFAALITGQPKQKKPPADVSRLPVKRGRGRPRIHPVTECRKEIWTCPVCGNEDNGNPMICCDGCNTWYHWVCVGIQIPPEASEDWYCRHCISNKMEHLDSDAGTKQRGKEKKW